MKKLFATLLTGFLIIQISPAQTQNENYSFSLQQAIDYAYQHQKDVVNAGLDEQIANAKVKETTGIGLPQINASFDVKDYVKLTYLFPGEFAGGAPGTFTGFELKTPQYAATAGVQASQLIFDGSYLVGLQASKTYRELSQKNFTRTKIETAVAVSKAYYGVLVNKARMELVTANVDRLKKLNDDTKALYDNGFVEKIDYDRVTLTYNNVVTEKEKTVRLMMLSDYLLKYQMGMNINAGLTLTDTMSADLVKNISVPAEKTDVTNRIEYSLLQSQQRLMQLDLKRYKISYLPSLVLYGNINTIAQRPEFDIFDSDKKWFPTGFIGATLSLPIFDGLQRVHKINQAKLALKKTESEIANTTNALNFETASNRTMLMNAIASFKTQEKNLELANEVYDVSKKKYDQGVGSNLEVINAETSLKESQTNYYSALYDALVAKVELDKAMGNIK